MALSDTVINLAAVPTATEGFLVIDPNTQASREVIYYNSKTASSVTCPDATQGSSRGLGGTTAQTHTSGTAVELRDVAEYWQALQNGQSLTGLHTWSKESWNSYPYVASGLVWTGDALGSTKAASMTAGTVYINGRRISISAVTSRTFTASKDTYVDILDNTDNTGTLVYTEVTNNVGTGSPALAANSIRIAIVVTGASSIAAAGSINQGDLTSVLPIVSSVAYTVSDSLGNLICNRNPNPVLIGYRQIISTFTSATAGSYVDVTGLSLSVIAPGNRKLRIRAVSRRTASTQASGSLYVAVNEGSTQLDEKVATPGQNNNANPVPEALPSLPTAGIHAYKVQVKQDNAGTITYDAGATYPAFISVELI